MLLIKVFPRIVEGEIQSKIVIIDEKKKEDPKDFLGVSAETADRWVVAGWLVFLTNEKIDADRETFFTHHF
jgi:hypothetical protein